MRRGVLRAVAVLAAASAGVLAASAALPAQESTTTFGPWEPQIPADAGTHPVGDLFIQGADTVWTAAGEVIPGGSILIRDGIIAAVGADLTPPDGVRIVDGGGMHAIPGLVDEHSHIAMAATNEGSSPIVAEIRVLDALDPDDFGIYRALTGGVTTARIMHGSANPIGGQSAVIKPRWGMEDTHDLLIPGAPRFVKFALGENVTRKGSPGSDRFPASRQGVEAVYRAAFTAALEYEAEHARHEANPGAFRLPPRTDLRMEALVDIMRGRIRIHAHSYRSDEILMLMRIAEEFGFRIDVFTHVLEGYKVAAEMAEHGAAGSTFSDWWQYKLEAYDAIPHNAALMHEAGVLTGINTDIPWLQSFFFKEIAKPVRYGGVDPEVALQMLTLKPAQMMHIDDKVGSLEEGKQGDVVLLSGSPFDTYTRVEKTVVDGLVYYDLSDEAGTRGEPFVALDPGTPGDATAIALPRSEARTLAAQVGGGAIVALVGGTVHPVSAAPIRDGVVLVQGERILAVGPAAEIPVPAGARRIDAAGRHVYPGFIDPISTLGIFEFGAVGQATDTDEIGQYNPHVRAIAAVQPHGAGMRVARMNGITATMVAQRSGIVEGMGGLIELSDDDTFERVAIADRAALVVDFPAPTVRPGQAELETFAHTHDDLFAGGNDGPQTLYGSGEHAGHGHGGGVAGAARGSHGAVAGPVGGRGRTAAPIGGAAGSLQEAEGPRPDLDGVLLSELVEFFRRATTYAATPSSGDDPTRRFETQVWAGDRVVLEAMRPAVTGEVPVFFRVDTDWQIEHLFLFMDEFPAVRPVVVGGSQAYKLADELAARDVPVVLTLNAGYRPTADRDDSVFGSWRNAALLRAAGVTLAFGSDDSADARNVPYMAAHAVSFGLPRGEALRALTLAPAEALGVADRMGSLEPGKRADILVTDGDPLQMLTRIERIFVGGVEVDPLDNKHDRLYERFRGRR
jgi:imidazolonepropionase-like amidohydrolase